MKNRMRKLLVLATAATLMTTAFTGCGSDSSSNSDGNADSGKSSDADTGNGSSSADLSGSISLAGSTSMQKLADALAETFMEAHSGVTVTVEYSGSSAGIESLLGGSCDIGDASRNLKDSEKEGGAVENIVAIDGIAVIVDKNNSVDGLTKQQLSDIYTGVITNWSEVGGSDTPIVVVGREAGSGTRGAFEEILDVADACKYAVECDTTGAAMAKVASTEGAIGYVSLDVLDDSVNALKLDEVEPTSENIVAGTYFLCRPFVMATKGEISDQNELVQAFFDFIKSEDGKAVVKAVGLITAE